MKKTVFLTLLLSSPVSLASQINGLIGLDMGFGGDTIQTVVKDDGSKDELTVGSAFGFHAGASWRFHQDIDARISAGYSSDSRSYKNGSIAFRRFPINVSSHYFLGNHGLGGGLAYHLYPKYIAELKGVVGGQEKVTMNDGVGYFVEYLYSTNGDGFYGGLRYTIISYHNPYINKDYDASNMSINLGVEF